jgi:lipopolysaccharide export system permease protein
MNKIIYQYIFKSISAGILFAVVILLTLDILISMIQQLNAVGTGDFTIGSAIYFTALTIPRKIFENFPVSSVVGVMIGLGALAASSELVVIQSAGISRIKLAWMTILTLLIWLVPMSLIGEYVVPKAHIVSESYRSSKLTKGLGLGVNSGVWVRDGQIIFNAMPVNNINDEASNNIVLNDVTVYELDENLQVIKVSKAEKATHFDKAWELENIEVTEFIDSGVKTHQLKSQRWPSRIEPEILSITHTRAKYLSIRDILKYKEFQKGKENTPTKYSIALWAKYSYPIVVLATALSGLPFIFGLVRSGGFGQRLLIGIMLGLILYLFNRTLLNMGEVFHLHPIMITVLPSLLISLTVLWLLKIQKKS